MQVRTAAEVWLSQRYMTGQIGSRTRTLYESRLAAFVAMYGDRNVSEVGKDEVRAWQQRIGRLSTATRRLYLSTVHLFLQWCAEEGYGDLDPTAVLPRVKEPRRAPRARTAPEVAALYRVARTQRQRTIIALMVQMGLRPCEVARLEVADWDRSGGTLFVRGKGGHERVLPVPEVAAAELAAYRIGMPASGPMICDRGDRRPLTPQYVSEIICGLLRLSGVKRRSGDGVTTYTLRHTAASDVLDRCGNVRTVQQMLGHQSLATTEIYLRRASLDQLRAAMDGRDYREAG